METVKGRLGRRIASLRRKAGLTQEQMAEKSGYSVAFIGLIERGVNAPTVDGLERLSSILHVEVADLFRELGSANQKAGRKPK